MANANTPFGGIYVRHRSGAVLNGAANPYVVASGDATALFIGDPVVLTGTGNTTQVEAPGVGSFKEGELAVVTRATAGITGFIVAVAADPTNLENQFRLASTERIVLVMDDPEALFEMQEDSVGGALAVTDIGLNVPLVAGTGDTITGRSGFQLDSSLAAATATLAMRLHSIVRREDNEIGTNAKWLVSVNVHALTTALGI